MYKRGWERSKWKVFKRSNAKIQPRPFGGRGVKEEIEEPREPSRERT